MSENELAKALSRLRLTSSDLESVITRQDKGVKISFYPKYVFKQYGMSVGKLSLQEQRQRFLNELAAYQQFAEFECSFVPLMVDFSETECWICIERVQGQSILEITQTTKGNLPMASILKQWDIMNNWLRKYGFPDTKSNTKDMLLTPDGQIYMIDFESYTPHIKPEVKPDVYNALINCVMERIVVRKGRTAKLTPAFLQLFFGIVRKRPGKALGFIVENLRVFMRNWIVNSAFYRGIKNIYRRIVQND